VTSRPQKKKENLDQIGQLISSEILRIKGETEFDGLEEKGNILKAPDSQTSKMTDSGNYNLKAIINQKGLPGGSKPKEETSTDEGLTKQEDHTPKVIEVDSLTTEKAKSQRTKLNANRLESLPVVVEDEIERKKKKTEEEMAKKVADESNERIQSMRQQQIEQIKSQAALDLPEEEERRKRNEELQRQEKKGSSKPNDSQKPVNSTNEGGLLKEGSKTGEVSDCDKSSSSLGVAFAILAVLLSSF